MYSVNRLCWAQSILPYVEQNDLYQILLTWLTANPSNQIL